MSDPGFLSRWSRRKTEAKQPEPKVEAPSPAALPAASPAAAPEPLPPIESLNADSDFTPFLREGVQEHLRRAALKTLFQDPRFNVMDGLDVYIDDYSKPDPLPEGWLEKLNQVARLGEYRAPEEDEKKPEEAAPEQPAEDSRSTSESDTSVPPETSPPVSES